MIVRVPDLPHEGLIVNFDLDPESLITRLDGASMDTSDAAVKPPAHSFSKQLPVYLKLSSDGRTVDMKGVFKGTYRTLCSRCAGEANESLEIPINIIVKPRSGPDDEEDVGFALYDGEDLDCCKVVEDIVILNIPFLSLCSEECQGLCSQCGKNLNLGNCQCVVEPDMDNSDKKTNKPFEKLKDFKILS